MPKILAKTADLFVLRSLSLILTLSLFPPHFKLEIFDSSCSQPPMLKLYSPGGSVPPLNTHSKHYIKNSQQRTFKWMRECWTSEHFQVPCVVPECLLLTIMIITGDMPHLFSLSCPQKSAISDCSFRSNKVGRQSKLMAFFHSSLCCWKGQGSPTSVLDITRLFFSLPFPSEQG